MNQYGIYTISNWFFKQFQSVFRAKLKNQLKFRRGPLNSITKI